MEVNQTYIEFLLQLLNSEENIDIEAYKEDLIVNLYLTLLSLSNLEYSEEIDKIEKETISDFLRKLNNLKVKIQLKRKTEEINKLAESLITQYYEDVNILSIYIKDGVELENVINTMDAKSLTKLIDKVTKDKMNKEDRKEEISKRRTEITKLLPFNKYYINNGIIYINNNDTLEEISIKDFTEMFSYLLNQKNYQKIYNNKSSQKNHEQIITNIIKLLMLNETRQEELSKVIIPITLNYILSLNTNNLFNLDTSSFNIENIKITELYSLASKEQPKENQNIKTTKWRNISIPNEYLMEKLKEMIKKGMYYTKEDTFILEMIENKTSDFKISISSEGIKGFLKEILGTAI